MCFPVNFCEIFKNTFFTENVWVTASESKSNFGLLNNLIKMIHSMDFSDKS